MNERAFELAVAIARNIYLNPLRIVDSPPTTDPDEALNNAERVFHLAIELLRRTPAIRESL